MPEATTATAIATTDATTEKSGWDVVGCYEWQGAPTEEDHAAIRKEIEAYCDALEAFTAQED